MMSCDPFEDLDDTLFNDFINEEVLDETLDVIDPLQEKKTKHCALRIKPLVMKRRWRGVFVRRKKNSDKAKHIEALLSLPLLDEDKVVQPCSPPTHDVEETTNLDDEEFEDLVEIALPSVLPTHKDKEMVIFSHTDGLMKEPFKVVDEHIDTFIRIGRRRWDMSCFIFYGYLFYDIEGHSQIKDTSIFS
jgi:hypothetical protein